MSIKKSILKIFNGQTWDEYYQKTSADQVEYNKDGSNSNVDEELNSLNTAIVWKDGASNYTGKKTYSMPTAYVKKVYDLYIKVDLGTTGVYLSIYIPFERLSDNEQQFRTGYFINKAEDGSINGGMVSFKCSNAAIAIDQAYLNGNNVVDETTWNVSVRYRD